VCRCRNGVVCAEVSAPSVLRASQSQKRASCEEMADSNGYLLHIMVSRLPMANSEFQDLGESIRVRVGWVLAEPAMGKWFENLDEEDVRSASIAAAMMLGFVCLVIVWYLEFRPPGYSD
jgi:hypothetical protein